jgi:chromosome partitioning protein
MVVSMHVFVMASRKGGAGKTTLSCHLAVEAERAGAGPVAIIDTDPMGGLAAWWDARKAETPVLARAEPDLPAALELLRQHGIKTVFVDTPPALNPTVAKTIREADLVVVPVQPSPDDLRAIGTTVEEVRANLKPLIFVINRTKPRVRLTGDAAIALSQHGVVAPVMVADRTDYAAAKIDGLTAQEVDAEGKASVEMAELWSYLQKRLEIANEQTASILANHRLSAEGGGGAARDPA